MNKYGELFETRKEGKIWKVYHVKTKAIVCSHKNKKEVVLMAENILNDKGEVKTKECIKAIHKKNIKNKLFLRPCIQRLFKNTFGQELHKFRDYMIFILSGEYRLDIIRLDKFMQVPDGVSCKEHIANKYGQRALKLVTKLM